MDTTAGLATTQNNKSLPIKFLRKKYHTQPWFKKQYRYAHEQDPNAATRMAHTLKGVSAKIGAHHVQEVVQQIRAGIPNPTER
ncbi:Hpt domain-containing protein [Magnetococcus sp. PR-3]|uniref:Hpt domain-containing protein n=1 Tax=Magnetococcus sp. PR-3 TaxID=3120355 RepID=UPI003FA5BA37